MKKFSLFILSLGMALNSFALIPESEYPIKIDETHFPDVHFREAFVKEYDTNSDGHLSYDEAIFQGSVTMRIVTRICNKRWQRNTLFIKPRI